MSEEEAVALDPLESKFFGWGSVADYPVLAFSRAVDLLTELLSRPGLLDGRGRRIAAELHRRYSQLAAELYVEVNYPRIGSRRKVEELIREEAKLRPVLRWLVEKALLKVRVARSRPEKDEPANMAGVVKAALARGGRR